MASGANPSVRSKAAKSWSASNRRCLWRVRDYDIRDRCIEIREQRGERRRARRCRARIEHESVLRVTDGAAGNADPKDGTGLCGDVATIDAVLSDLRISTLN